MRGLLFIAVLVLFSGCAKMYNSNEVSINETGYVYTYKTGVVESVKKVVLKGEGDGVSAGVMTGTVLGSLFGKGKGNVLATLLGGLGGAYAGAELDKANGEELFIKLEDGRDIVVYVRGVDIQKGDRVRVILNGSKVIRVEKI